MHGELRSSEYKAGKINVSMQRRRSSFRVAVGKWMTRSAVFMSCVAAHGQAMANCPGGHRLTLGQVAGLIQARIRGSIVVDRVDACHVSFSLDAPSLVMLVDAGMTDGEFNVLNPETAAELTVEQAHAEVAGLEAYVAGPDATLSAQRDAEFQRLNAQYQTERAKAAKVPPKDPFTSTADYDAQVQRAQAAATGVDRNHETAVAQVNADYQSKLDLRNTLFLARIEFLKKSEYKIAVPATFTNYNADTERLTAAIGGEEYWFDEVPGETARELNENWKNVKVTQPFTDDGMHSRTLILTLPTRSIAQLGRQRRAVEAVEVSAHLEEANSRRASQNYSGAIDEYEQALKVDPTNNEAKDGIVAAQSAQQAAAKLQEQQTAARQNYEEGRRLDRQKQYAAAKTLWEKACDGGELIACTDLGVLYVEGQGVKRDYAQAKSIFEKSCNAGELYGCTCLGAIYEHGKGVRRDYSQARALEEKACNGGDMDGCEVLGELYYFGWGVPANEALARMYVERACQGHVQGACDNLRNIR